MKIRTISYLKYEIANSWPLSVTSERHLLNHLKLSSPLDMALHLVGDTIDKGRAHYQSRTGKLIQLMRGVYVDAADDIEPTLRKYAVRIARYLYPNSYLSAASAALLAPTSDGRLFLSGGRVQRTRLRSLEIIQNKAPASPALAMALVDDGEGEFGIAVSTIPQRFLEAFRIRSEHAGSLDPEMRLAIARRLVEEYGSPRSAAEAVWSLARKNDWHREGEDAERCLLHSRVAAFVRNEAGFELTVGWHGKAVGTLGHDGFEWRWRATEEARLPLVRQASPGRLPPFIESLLPEGWLAGSLGDCDERSSLRSGERYMSNISVVADDRDLARLPADDLSSRLDEFTSEGRFTGTYAGPGREHRGEGFEDTLALYFALPDTPRPSGFRVTAPMFLDSEGNLMLSSGVPFTHILKPAGTGGLEGLPAVEWMALALCKAVGFMTPATALVAMPNGMPAALVVERFDIRTGPDDPRFVALEDFCAVFGLPSASKYDRTIERVAQALRLLSTSPSSDVQLLVKRALFASLIADGDMHLKSLALLKIAEADDSEFETVTLAPPLSAVSTLVFPELERTRMALKLNGKDDHLVRSDFRALGSVAGIRQNDIDAMIDGTVDALSQAIEVTALPNVVSPGSAGEVAVSLMLSIISERLKELR